jgi:hypothetical protein
MTRNGFIPAAEGGSMGSRKAGEPDNIDQKKNERGNGE